VKQIEDISYIKDRIGLDNLPEGLKDVALTRLANPDVPLKELGGLLRVPVGKSGVNHRLRKLSEMAEKLRGN
jgi:DNA-binding protein WhiA